MRLSLIISLVVVWTLSGLIGHDPWKPDEAYSFGLVYHILQQGDWVVPTLANEPFMEKPPLYYLTAAAIAPLFSKILPLHDAARLTSGFYLAVVFLFLALTARELYGKGMGRYSVLMLIGCFGLLIRSHQLITDVALLAGFAVGLYGIALSLRRPYWAGFAVGTGAGMGFLAKGLIAPGLLGLIVLSLPVFSKHWRIPGYPQLMAIALLCALPWFGIWTTLLYLRSPDLFEEWFLFNNIGRFMGLTNLGPEAEPLFYFKTLVWYALPALPFATYSIWQQRAQPELKPNLLMPLIAFLVMFSVLSLASDARELYAMPLLLPLSLLATSAFQYELPRGFRLLRNTGWLLFGGLLVLLWIGWGALFTGYPDELAHHLQNYQPNFVEEFRPVAMLLAMFGTAAWLRLSYARLPLAQHALLVWTGGITAVWLLIGTLWLPFLNAGNSYLPMIQQLQAALPKGYHCLNSQALGEPQRALLEYSAGIITYRVEPLTRQYHCDLLLLQTEVGAKTRPAGDWQEIWAGHRAGDKRELFKLFARVDVASRE